LVRPAYLSDMPKQNDVLRRLAVSFAIATWCFLNTWVELAEGNVAYFLRYNPLTATVVPVVCLEVLLALGVFGVWEVTRRQQLTVSRAIGALYLAACGVPLGIAAIAALRLSPWDVVPIVRQWWFWPLVCLLAVVPVYAALQRPLPFCRLMGTLFLYSWPILALLMVQASRRTLLAYSTASYADGPLAAVRTVAAPRNRVVWIIFDELSQAITFSNRPPGLQLQNFDQLRRESFYATSAQSAGDSTRVSMPALTLGEEVIEALPSGTADLRLRTRSQPESFSWSSAPNVFDSARGLGLNTALVGWFHPYGRLLNRSLTRCYWTADWMRSGIEEPFQRQSLPTAMADRLRLQFISLPLAGHLPGVFPGIYGHRSKRERFEFLLDRARDTATDSSIGLVLIHLNVPHPPAIYSRSTGSWSDDASIGYPDSVALADRTLGTLRRAMEESRVWDGTTLIVSADHGWRTSSWRGTPEWSAEDESVSHQETAGVPFLLRLPGQSTGVAYDKRFNTVVTRRLIIEILEGRLSDPARIADSIERPGSLRR
jgi:hypothetical protein